jgi:hypothetical protein
MMKKRWPSWIDKSYNYFAGICRYLFQEFLTRGLNEIYSGTVIIYNNMFA